MADNETTQVAATEIRDAILEVAARLTVVIEQLVDIIHLMKRKQQL